VNGLECERDRVIRAQRAAVVPGRRESVGTELRAQRLDRLFVHEPFRGFEHQPLFLVRRQRGREHAHRRDRMTVWGALTRFEAVWV